MDVCVCVCVCVCLCVCVVCVLGCRADGAHCPDPCLTTTGDDNNQMYDVYDVYLWVSFDATLQVFFDATV